MADSVVRLDDDTLFVTFASKASLLAQVPHLSRQTAFVPSASPEPQPLSTIKVAFVAGERSVTFSGRVLQVVPGVGVAVECGEPEIGQWVVNTANVLPEQGEEASAQWGKPEEGDASGIDEEETTDGEQRASLREKIREMSTNEKFQLALHGGKTARTILLRDPNKNVQSYIIRNRKLTLDEVRYIAGFRQANPDVLKQIGESREWMQNPRIASALVGNPKTPSVLAKKLLAKLPITEVRRLAKSSNTPQAVAAAARKMVAGRKG